MTHLMRMGVPHVTREVVSHSPDAGDQYLDMPGLEKYLPQIREVGSEAKHVSEPRVSFAISSEVQHPVGRLAEPSKLDCISSKACCHQSEAVLVGFPDLQNGRL
jgi:hypothetical protein